MNFTARSWHNWVSIILALPILIVAVTAVFIAHDKALGLKQIDITAAVGWLPGYQAKSGKQQQELGSTLQLTDGRLLLGTKNGLYQVADGRAEAVAALGNTQVRDLLQTRHGVLAATKNGIWLMQQGQWQQTHTGDAWNLSQDADGRLQATIKDEGLLRSADGRQWQTDRQLQQVLAALPAVQAREPITLGKLVMDLHTGKALLGKRGEWLWIDAVGLAMTLLGATGIYLWWRGEKRKRQQGETQH